MVAKDFLVRVESDFGARVCLVRRQLFRRAQGGSRVKSVVRTSLCSWRRARPSNLTMRSQPTSQRRADRQTSDRLCPKTYHRREAYTESLPALKTLGCGSIGMSRDRVHLNPVGETCDGFIHRQRARPSNQDKAFRALAGQKIRRSNTVQTARGLIGFDPDGQLKTLGRVSPPSVKCTQNHLQRSRFDAVRELRVGVDAGMPRPLSNVIDGRLLTE